MEKKKKTLITRHYAGKDHPSRETSPNMLREVRGNLVITKITFFHPEIPLLVFYP